MDLDVRGARKLFKNREQLLNEQRWIDVKFDIYEQIKKRALEGFQSVVIVEPIAFEKSLLYFAVSQLKDLGYKVEILNSGIEISWE